MAALRRLVRRLSGRDGLEMPARDLATEALDTTRKALEAGAAVREAREAVDAFTLSVERAMRGQRQAPRRPPRGQPT